MIKYLLTILVVLMQTTAAFAQQTDAELRSMMAYMQRAMLFNKALPQEKVYLHFDNTGYFMGETIWFKAYVVRADNSQPTDMSHVVYVELVNPSGDVVETRKLPVQDGCAHGDIKLDSLCGTGFYEVRAYTRYMTNWGNGGIFSRVFPVFKAPAVEGDYSKMVIDSVAYRNRLPNMRNDGDIQQQILNAEASKKKLNEKTDTVDRSKIYDKEYASGSLRVRFFPEGGHLVKGLPCKVAFLATDRDGKQIPAGGSLLNADKQLVDAVSIVREGRGVFSFTPDGTNHYLRLADSKGHQHDFRLPEAETEGISLALNTLDNDEISALIYSTPTLQGRLLGYTIMNNGRTLRADTVYAERAMQLLFDRSQMGAGVNQITFFLSNGYILAERSFFICPPADKADSIRITSPVAFPKPCGKITVDIQAQPNSQLSFSAMDAATMVNGKEGNARTYMLLSSEIKGYIENPGYYFESDDRQHRLAADLLMMVQGWKRYDWEFMAGLKPSENAGKTEKTPFLPVGIDGFNQPIEDKLYLHGQLRQKFKKNTVDNVWLDVFIYNNQGYHYKGETKTDSLGFYAFSLPDDLKGEYRMMINTGKEDKRGNWKDASFYVGIDRHFSPGRRLIYPSEQKTIELLKPNLFHDQKTKQAAANDNEYIPINKRDHVLANVTVKARRKSIFENARASWETESFGQKYGSIFYNADEDCDRYCDAGLEVPGFYEWLAWKNPYFGGNGLDGDLTVSTAAAEAVSGNTQGLQSADKGTAGEALMGGDQQSQQVDEMTQHATDSDRLKIYEDGLGYKNRPIVWVLNNDWAAISNLGRRSEFSLFEIHRNTVLDLPIFLDEVRKVYVSESPNAFQNCLICPDLAGMGAVTVFVYTRHPIPKGTKGMRNTQFQGYNEPSVFTMEDYSVLPPVEDFRRTIFWAPDVVTDAKGKAEVEFWNNSSCKEMYISCEGITPEGKVLVNE